MEDSKYDTLKDRISEYIYSRLTVRRKDPEEFIAHLAGLQLRTKPFMLGDKLTIQKILETLEGLPENITTFLHSGGVMIRLYAAEVYGSYDNYAKAVAMALADPSTAAGIAEKVEEQYRFTPQAYQEIYGNHGELCKIYAANAWLGFLYMFSSCDPITDYDVVKELLGAHQVELSEAG